MKKTWLVALLFLAAVVVAVFFAKTTNPGGARSTGDSPVAAVYDRRESSTGVPPVMDTPRQAGRLPYNPTISEAAQLAPFFSAPIALQDGGRERPFELATDQLYLRGEDGASSLLSIPATSTPEALAAAIEQARAEHGTEPELVLYPAGLPRDEFTRRIVTREVVVNAPSRAEADILAAAQGLEFQKAPVFAPNAFVYKAPTSAAALGVLTRQEVASADATPLLASLAAKKTMPNDPFVQLQWHLKYQGQQGAVEGTDINVESVWNYPSISADNSIRGRGVVIGIVDDGMEWSHPDLAPNVIKELQYDWNGQDNDPKPDYFKVDADGYLDPDNHGTACAGVAAARGNNRIGVSGVAPEANLAGMRLIAGPSTDLDEAEAMTWKMGDIHVLSNSWGYPAFEATPDLSVAWYPLRENGPLTEAALKYAVDYGRGGRGTIITFAAGNDDEFYVMQEDQSITSEKSGARMDFSALQSSIYTIAVGAVNSMGVKSNYSQIGAALLISAPSNTTDGSGLGVMTTDNKGRFGYNRGFQKHDFASSGDVTKTFGGTSSACPVVSGVIALMLEENPDLGWRDVQEILIRSAVKVDEDDADWIENGAGLHFNHKYGAGLVNAAAAVELASTWINLGPQKSQTVSPNETTPIAVSGNATFAVDGDILVEHVTLRLTIEDIKKGDLTITLRSPSGTVSTFCEPHSDNDPEDGNEFTNWRFMTVRNWGELSSGNWTLTITNNGTTAGNLTAAELVVFGTDDSLATPPVVTVEASATSLFVGENLTLAATAIDKLAKNEDGSSKAITELEAFVDGASLGAGTNGTWTLQANNPGTYTFTVNATGSLGEVTTSEPIEVTVVAAPIAAWDFDTTTLNPVPLTTAIQGPKRYESNFGNGVMVFDGSQESSAWNEKTGEIWRAEGSQVNAVGGMWSGSRNNTALLVRGGKDTAAEGKGIVFQFSMEGQEALNVSYTTVGNDVGFQTHTWSYSTDGSTWTEVGQYPLAPFMQLTVGDAFQDALAGQPDVYLLVELTGASAAWGQNIIDNIVFSAEPITPPAVVPPFTPATPTKAHAADGPLVGEPSEPHVESPTAGDAEPAEPVEPEGPSESDDLDWVVVSPAIHEMTVHAEVVNGTTFLTTPGSLLSATEEGKVLGLAEPVPQTTRYELGITSAEPNPEPLRLKVYDAASQGILVLDEKVPFTSGATLGSPSVPKRYRVAYQEVEQVVPVAPGWNTFTTAVDPDPATLAGALADYDFSEGDRLIGPTAEVTVVDGKWTPSGFEFEPEATYSLLRQASNDSQIILKGRAVNERAAAPVTPAETSSKPPVSAPLKETSGNSPVLASSSGSHSGSSHAHESHGDSHASADKSSKKSKTSKKSISSKKSKGKDSEKKKSGKKKKSRR